MTMAARIVLDALISALFLAAALALPQPPANVSCRAPDSMLRNGSGAGRRLYGTRHASVHLAYSAPVAQPRAWYMSLVPQASSEATYFGTNSHGFGYLGLQQVNHRGLWFKGQAIFSIWDAGCDAWQRATLVECGPRARCDRFGGEGTGVRTIVPFNEWQLGRSYGFMVEATQLGPDRVRYDGYVHAPELGGWVLLGKVSVTTWGKQAWHLHGMTSFVEQWHSGGFSDMRLGRFGPSFVEQDGGANSWAPVTAATFQHTTAPGEDVSKCYGSVSEDKRTWGLGIGGALPKIPMGAMLQVQAQGVDFPGPLSQFIDLRNRGHLQKGCAGQACPLDPFQNLMQEVSHNVQQMRANVQHKLQQFFGGWGR